MKLYAYDHCPYCVKARMIFGFKKIPFQLVILADDDKKTPVSMIGVKMTPILEFEPSQYMPESLDIISYVDKKHPTPLVSWRDDKKLLSWFDEIGSLHYELAMPRWVQAPLKEFKTKSARDHFKKRLEPKVGSFKKLLKETKDLKNEMEEHLLDLENLFQKENLYFKKRLTVNDFHLFALLRSLSIVKGLKFPPKVKTYMNKISKESKVPLHTSIAL